MSCHVAEGRGVEGDTGTHQGGQEAKGVKENCGRNFHYGFCTPLSPRSWLPNLKAAQQLWLFPSSRSPHAKGRLCVGQMHTRWGPDWLE